MSSLVDILRDKQTDKVANGLAQVYDELFGSIRYDVEEILEIGVDRGGSIEGWLEFFPRAMVNGYDIRDCDLQHERFCMWIGDIADTYLLEKRFKNLGTQFDIVIDDGSHINAHIIGAFEILWDFVKPGGYYVVEDIQVPFRNPDYPKTEVYFTNFARDQKVEFDVRRYNLLYVRKPRG